VIELQDICTVPSKLGWNEESFASNPVNFMFMFNSSYCEFTYIFLHALKNM